MKDLLKKWLNGTATWSEEKKLRQATEQDHFLAEAMEGYDTFPITDHAAKIDQLKGRFRKPKKEEKGIVFSLSKIAAAAAVIGVIGTFFWVQQEIEQTPAISQAIEEIEAPLALQNKEENAVAEAVIDNEAEGIELTETTRNALPKPAIQQTINPNKSKKKTTIAEATNTATPLAETIVPSAEIASNEEISEVNIPATADLVEPPIIAANQKSEPAADVAYSAPAAPVREKKRSFSKQRNTKYKEAATIEKVNYYVGQVQNEDGQPMNDVKILGLNTSFKTTTSLNGEFILETGVPLTKIAVSKDGFYTRKIAINQYSDFLNISLVKQSTTVPADADNVEMLTLAPKPEAGFVDFFNYIAKNQLYPEGAKAKGIERSVEIRFYIDKNGTPTKLKVSNPDLYGFDKEAIRLLKNGPKWMPANSHARYYVAFELE